jgi:ABC-2 type transport system permease protein
LGKIDKVSKTNNLNKKTLLLQFAAVVGICILLNVIGTKLHSRLDVTDDSRFTLSAPTQKFLKSMPNPINIKILLDGKMPANYEKLRTATIDMLEGFKEASGGKVLYSFENPLEGKSMDEKIKLGETLKQKGIFPVPTTAQVDEDGAGMEQRILFPHAIVNGNAKEEIIELRENHVDISNPTTTDNDVLNYSESMLEYKFINAIRKIETANKPNVAYITGHGEVINNNTLHLLYLLSQYYKVDTINLPSNIDIPAAYKAAIMVKPTGAFDDKEKFKLDQFVMGGGRMLWLIEGATANLDTLKAEPSFLAAPSANNLDNILFKYGVRINNNLVQDLQCGKTPVKIGMVGGDPDIKLLDWPYFPLPTPTSKHPVVNNLDAVLLRFASSIDTINNGINKKTILLESSTYAKNLPTPAIISLNELKFKPKTSTYTKKNVPMAVAIEGNFESAYKIMDPTFINTYTKDLKKQYRTATKGTNKMIVVADGDWVLNDFSNTNGPSEMGFDKFMQTKFANSTFLLNCMEWLTDESGLLEARNKDVKLRTLDPDKVKKQKSQYQFLNIILPILFTLITASAWFFFRKRKYESV